jgi:hypothetical protein
VPICSYSVKSAIVEDYIFSPSEIETLQCYYSDSSWLAYYTSIIKYEAASGIHLEIVQVPHNFSIYLIISE